MSAAYVAQGLYADQLLADADSIPRSLIAIALQFFVVATLLYLKKLSTRLPQTLSALAGTGLVFGFLSIFLISQADPSGNQSTLALVWFGVFLWSIAVDAHIYRHSLSIRMSLGVLMVVLILGANFLLFETVLGD